MEEHRFRYVSIAHSAVGVGCVGITLEREEGIQFVAVLNVDDAKRLIEDLPQQVRIADQNSN